jgi:uncharacterized protein (TIGR03435 family)
MRAIKVGILWTILVFGSGSTLAQSPMPEFEVASMRLSEAEGGLNWVRTGGPGTTDPGRLTYINAPLDQIIADAFDIQRSQIRGPDFIVTQRYNIVAKVPGFATPEGVRQMLQTLLAQRIHLISHVELKLQDGYELRLSASQLKVRDLIATLCADLRDPLPDDQIQPDEAGFPILPPGVRWGLGYKSGHTRAAFRCTSMQQFAQFLGTRLGTQHVGGAAEGKMSVEPAPILDKTGMNGLYDFAFDYEAFPFASLLSVADLLNSLNRALGSQLGLVLVRAKVQVRGLAIEHLEKQPADN